MIQIEPNKWETIRSLPVSVDKNHESLYRSYAILEVVTEMLERGDSQQTVLEFIRFCQSGEPIEPEITFYNGKIDGLSNSIGTANGDFTDNTTQK